ncbi:hypothetical protein V8C43DRAFT_53125 [Trichoderma afarasin]
MMQGPWGVLSEPKPIWWIKPYSFACKGKQWAAILMKLLVLILSRSYADRWSVCQPTFLVGVQYASAVGGCC